MASAPPAAARQCLRCDVVKPVAEFAAKRGRRLTLHCRRCRSYGAGLDDEGVAERAARKVQYRRDHPWETWAYRCLHAKRAAGAAVSLTADDLLALLAVQNHRCALTGLPFWAATKMPGSASWDSPSLDRVAHGGAYALRNVRVVLHCVNTFRGRMRDDQMILVARALLARADGHRPRPALAYLRDVSS